MLFILHCPRKSTLTFWGWWGVIHCPAQGLRSSVCDPYWGRSHIQCRIEGPSEESSNLRTEKFCWCPVEGRRSIVFVTTSAAAVCVRLRLKCDGTRAETRFRLPTKRTSLFKSAGGVSSLDYWQPRCALSAVVMLDKPCSEVVWRVLATHSVHQFPLYFLSRASPCIITFQLDSTTHETSNTLTCLVSLAIHFILWDACCAEAWFNSDFKLKPPKTQRGVGHASSITVTSGVFNPIKHHVTFCLRTYR